MALVELPVNVEALAVAHLSAAGEVLALVDEDHVSTELPADAELPYLKVDLLPGSSSTPQTAHVVRSRVQLSAWGPQGAGGKLAAWDLIAAAWAALMRADQSSHAYGVVTGTDAEVLPYWSPDPETDEPRYLAVIALFVHP